MTTPGNVIHARAVIAPCHLRGLSPGAATVVDGGWLMLGAAARVEVAHAPVWNPPLVQPGEAAEPRNAAVALTTLIRGLHTRAPSSGMAPAIAHVAAAVGEPDRDIEVPLGGSELLRRVVDSALARRPDVLSLAAGLLGLGPGLTPSGDDFAGGLVFAMRALHVAYPDRFPWDEEGASRMLVQAREQTNAISAELLGDHMRGRGAGPLHDVAEAVLTAQSAARLTSAAEGLMRIGRTTGWDILTGYCAGMLPLCFHSRN